MRITYGRFAGSLHFDYSFTRLVLKRGTTNTARPCSRASFSSRHKISIFIDKRRSSTGRRFHRHRDSRRQRQISLIRLVSLRRGEVGRANYSTHSHYWADGAKRLINSAPFRNISFMLSIEASIDICFDGFFMGQKPSRDGRMLLHFGCL